MNWLVSSIQALWGNTDVEWKAKDAQGLAGGIWISWKVEKFKLTNCWMTNGVVGVEGEWRDIGKPNGVANIYSLYEVRGKVELCNDLSQKVSNSNISPWCLIGDFNEVKDFSERKGSQPMSSSSSPRNNFLNIPLSGRKYTWSPLNGKCCNIIGRALVSDEWYNDWEGCNRLGLPKGSSDHCPIFLSQKVQNWGPKPFRFFNAWLRNSELATLVEDKRKEYEIIDLNLT
ncbi:hypothetical protein OROHE_010278 [Orobanche hederae]